MLLEWILREGWMLPMWWLLVTLAGLSALPFALRFLSGLPDRGYTLSRALGMLLVALIYWLLASYGFIGNSTGGMVFAWVIVLSLGLVAYFTGDNRVNLRDYWRENRSVIIVAELLFVTLLAVMMVYRAYQNDTFWTEKPMEMAFISGIMRSETFPPNDPWMAGYAISYYYFGYVMTAMLTMLSGINSGYGFSMMIVTTFALAGLTIFGVGYNLARSRTIDSSNGKGRTPALLTGLLAFVFVLVMSNFQFALFETPFRTANVPASYFEWWNMQGFTDLESISYIPQGNAPLLTTPVTHPDQWYQGGFGWWWHTSRILTDYNFDGSYAAIQPINEVPAFSFILMDLHPHVLSLPFVVLAIGMALNIVLLGQNPSNYHTVLYGLIAGALFFLNTWDGPLFLVFIAGAEALRRVIYRDGSLLTDDWLALIRFGASLLAVTFITYLPFFISFRSQAGGLVPNLMTPTAFQHYFLMFGPMLLLIGGFLLREVWIGTQQKRMNWSLGFAVSGGILGVLVFVMVMFIIIGALLPQTRNFVTTFIQANGGMDVVLPEILNRQLSTVALPILLFIILATIVARLFPTEHSKTDDDTNRVTYPLATGFALLAMAAAFGVTLVPEFVYLRDNFGTRINTIFKFYYQAWILLGIVASYSVYTILLHPVRDDNSRFALGLGYAPIVLIVLIMTVPYLPFGMYTRAILEENRHRFPAEQQATLSLDGRSGGINADYFAALQCLANTVQGDDVVVVEATRDTYNSQYGRIGAFYGIPTVHNWSNHQRQWRGETYDDVAGNREFDIQTLYSDLRWEIAVPIIEQYGIDYIMYGTTERRQYGDLGEDKFRDNLTAICEFGDARVYVVGETLIRRFE
ncbi:MAG: DUF2298 domain-containing protein [Chloroflexota bacterium]